MGRNDIEALVLHTRASRTLYGCVGRNEGEDGNQVKCNTLRHISARGSKWIVCTFLWCRTPVWVRGSKFLSGALTLHADHIAPHMGAWIEMCKKFYIAHFLCRTPQGCVGQIQNRSPIGERFFYFLKKIFWHHFVISANRFACIVKQCSHQKLDTNSMDWYNQDSQQGVDCYVVPYMGARIEINGWMDRNRNEILYYRSSKGSWVTNGSNRKV